VSWLVALAVASASIVALWPGAWPWRLAFIDDATRAHGLRPAREGGWGGPPAGPPDRRRLHGRVLHRSRGTTNQRSDLPACVDLLVVALSAGAGLHEALVSVGAFGGPGRALEVPAAHLQRGVPLLDVLDALPGALGAHWQSVATTLALTATSGSPALPALRRLAAAERTRGRRLVEQRVRRLPVMLLVPLVTLVLPAFALVTFVPLLLTLGSVLGP